MHTNGGNYAKVLVTAVSGGTITLQYQTYGGANSSGIVALTAGASGPSAPSVTQILNNYGLVPAGYSNSGIAQGSLFIIKGSGLADPNAQAVLQSSASPGLQTTLNGASVTVTSNGVKTTPAFYYAIASQLALVLPSNTPVGNATLTVSYGGQTSAPAAFQVVASTLGFITYYAPTPGQAASGLATALSIKDGSYYTYINSIPPGTEVELWGSGLGADPARDTTFTPGGFSINGLSHIYIGGVDANILYQGASGFPGLNQINVIIPNNAATGCAVSLVGVNASGVPTNFVSLPIGNGVCSDPAFGTTGTTLQTGGGNATVKTGIVELFQATEPATTGTGTQINNLALGLFEGITGASYGSDSGSVSIGGCVVTQSVSTGTAPTVTYLDAGSLSVTGPSGTLAMPAGITGEYLAQPAAGFISPGGTYTFKGTGGTGAASVGPFSALVSFPNPLLVWSNSASFATVTRGSGATFNWTGGTPGSYVIMEGQSTGSATGAFANYACIAPQSAGSFTVPAYVLSVLPAGTGASTLENTSSYQTFTATGLDSGLALGAVVFSVNSTYN